MIQSHIIVKLFELQCMDLTLYKINILLLFGTFFQQFFFFTLQSSFTLFFTISIVYNVMHEYSTLLAFNMIFHSFMNFKYVLTNM